MPICNFTEMPLLFATLLVLCPPNIWRAFVIHGACMSLAMADAETIEDLDEALRHLSLVPNEERGTAWYAYLDAILEQRATLEPGA